MDIYSIGALPIGFSMKLSQDLTAMEHFTALSDQEKRDMIAYIQGGTTGEDAEERVMNALERLH